MNKQIKEMQGAINLHTAVAFMVCDGEMVNDEIDQIKAMQHNGQIEESDIDSALTMIIEELNASGSDYLRNYLHMVEDANLTGEEELQLLKIGASVILADNDVKYDEVKFFRTVRQCLKHVSDDEILKTLPEIDDFWLEADVATSKEGLEKDFFDNLTLPHFEL